jgi:hypothetical protein
VLNLIRQTDAHDYVDGPPNQKQVLYVFIDILSTISDKINDIKEFSYEPVFSALAVNNNRKAFVVKSI